MIAAHRASSRTVGSGGDICVHLPSPAPSGLGLAQDARRDSSAESTGPRLRDTLEAFVIGVGQLETQQDLPLPRQHEQQRTLAVTAGIADTAHPRGRTIPAPEVAGTRSNSGRSRPSRTPTPCRSGDRSITRSRIGPKKLFGARSAVVDRDDRGGDRGTAPADSGVVLVAFDVPVGWHLTTFDHG